MFLAHVSLAAESVAATADSVQIHVRTVFRKDLLLSTQVQRRSPNAEARAVLSVTVEGHHPLINS
jgi:hypothetical protein